MPNSGQCQCDSGDVGPSCPLTGSNNPQTVITDFDTTSNAIPFPVTYGATLSTECGVLSSGRSLVFKYDMLTGINKCHYIALHFKGMEEQEKYKQKI